MSVRGVFAAAAAAVVAYAPWLPVVRLLGRRQVRPWRDSLPPG
ncbi:hypothetical protein [Micromonospora sp. CPCC 205556]